MKPSHWRRLMPIAIDRNTNGPGGVINLHIDVIVAIPLVAWAIWAVVS